MCDDFMYGENGRFDKIFLFFLDIMECCEMTRPSPQGNHTFFTTKAPPIAGGIGDDLIFVVVSKIVTLFKLAQP